MKSTPIHPPIELDSRATAHLLWVAGDAGALLRRLKTQEHRGELTLIHVGDPAPDLSDAMRVERFADEAPALVRLGAVLTGAHMGTRLYVAAPEDLIWRVWHVAAMHGLSRDQVQTERLGSAARPMFCVHCRHISRSVRMNIARCAGCGRWLLIRDHFSRRWGAYMGFQIDAEVPGVLPAIHEVFP